MTTDKQVLRGTHRAVVPEVTWARAQPTLGTVGITRVADLTGLDVIGIPVFQAVRPNAQTLSVSQGKGITAELARVSAVMECIELWHAENVPTPTMTATVTEMASELPYSVFDLPRPARSALSPNTRLHWTRAIPVAGTGSVWVPHALVHLSSLCHDEPSPPLFHRSSNGLASGNTVEEALLHGLYEVVERDAIQRMGTWGHFDANLDLGTIPAGTAHWALERFAAADVEVRVRDLTPVAALPCYQAEIWSRALPLRFEGSGCHRDPDVALSRALTEAAQSRLTLIAGTRDDIPDDAYRWITSRSRLRSPFPDTGKTSCFASAAMQDIGTFADDLRVVLDAVKHRAVDGVFWVELTRSDLDIPVIQVIAPGMKDVAQ